VYSVILIPLPTLRIAEFNGNSVPFELTATAGVLFNYMGPVIHFVSDRPLTLIWIRLHQRRLPHLHGKMPPKIKQHPS
jgi:hypothetical protein